MDLSKSKREADDKRKITMEKKTPKLEFKRRFNPKVKDNAGPLSKKSAYEVVIVGSGPAGMFAAYELAKNGITDVLIIDKGSDVQYRKCRETFRDQCRHCEPCGTMCGVGGAGTYSDGTLNLRPDIGGDLEEQTGDKEYAWELVNYVDSIFLEFGATKDLHIPNEEEVVKLKRRAASVGARFLDIKQRHMGSDKAPDVISNFKNSLEKSGVEFLLNTEVLDLIIKNGTCKGVILKNKINHSAKSKGNEKGAIINAKYILIAPGRVGAEWTGAVVEKHRIKACFGHIDVGVRVEVPSNIMEDVTNVNRDPKFHIQTEKYDDFVRTFCTNVRGFVVKEEYDKFVCTNGFSNSAASDGAKSENTNFAFLVRIKLTEPLENTNKYGRSIAKLATTIGGGKPVLQRMIDLDKGRRSTYDRIARNPVVNTLKDVTPGDISMALPERILTDVKEGLQVLNKIIPGITSGSTLLYAPEVKFYSMVVSVDKNMETSVKGLFAAGDGAGLSRDIVNASATGIIAARGMLKKQGK